MKNTISIMFVGKNPVDRALIGKQLKEKFDIQTIQVNSSDFLVNSLENTKVQVVFIEDNLNWIPVNEAIRLIKAELPESLLFLILNEFNQETIDNCIDAGIDDYLIKSNNDFYKISLISKLINRITTDNKFVTKVPELQSLDITHSRLGIYRINSNGTLIFVNTEMAKMLGYKNLEEIIKYSSENEPFSVINIKRRIENGTGTNEYLWKTFDNKEIKVCETLVSVDKNDCDVNYYDGFVENISYSEQIENEFFRFVEVISQAAVSILITDIEGKIVYVNPFLEQNTGYSFSELIGKNPNIFKSGLHKSSFYKTLWTSISNDQVWKGTIINRKKDNTLYEEEAIIFPIKNKKGEKINYAAVKQDVTIKSKAEKIQKIVYNISNAIHTTSNINQLFFEIRKELGRIIDTKNFYIALYDKFKNTLSLPFFIDERDSFKTFPAGKTLTSLIIKEQKSLLLKYDDILKLESEGIVDRVGSIAKVWLGIPLVSNNEIIGILGVQSYEDENAYTEKDLDFLEFVSKQIGLSIERKNSETKLKETKDKAVEGDILKTSFLNNMSHETRTPLNAIYGFSSLLESDDLSKEEKVEYINYIRSSVNQLLGLFDDIIDISKIESGENVLSISEFNVNQLFLEIFHHYNDVHSQTSGKNIQLRINLQKKDQPFFIVSDYKRVRQIMMYLLSNSYKFTDFGLIEFGYIISQPDAIQFYVKDTGIGIPSDKQSYIFKKFYKISYKNKLYSGAGLGLAIAKNLITMLGGEIWFDSEINKGTTFYFTLPVNYSEPEDNKFFDGGENLAFNWSKKLFLVAEDTDSNYYYIEAALKKTQVKLIWVKDGNEAIETAKMNDSIDLILMDIRMPFCDGCDATRQIKEFKKEIPVIAQTAYAMADDKERAMNAGCDDYITKPISSNDLIKVIHKHLQKK